MYADIILADPAWHFSTRSDRGRGRSPKYMTDNVARFASLPVQAAAAPDCALFMWATYPLLPDAMYLGMSWGFTYKTVAFTWAKLNRVAGQQAAFLPVSHNSFWFMGNGYWTRSNPEVCLLFTRGKPQRVSKSVRNLVVAPIDKHSRKPDEIHQRIEKLMGTDNVRLELFARREYEGWHCFGNEITGNDLSVDLARFIES